MPPDKASAPRSATEGATKTTGGRSPDSLADLDDIARHIDGAFVVVVERTAGKYRRRCYLTCKAAEAAAQRATARGGTATVYLAELRPLWKVRRGDDA